MAKKVHKTAPRRISVLYPLPNTADSSNSAEPKKLCFANSDRIVTKKNIRRNL